MIYYIIIAMLAGLYKTYTMYQILIKNNKGNKFRAVTAIILTFIFATVLFPLMIIDLLIEVYKKSKIRLEERK